MLDAPIATLQIDSPFERLKVVEDGLSLDRDLPTDATNRRVPCSKVTRNRERHFRPEGEIRRKSTPKALQQPGLTGVPNGVPTGEGSNGEVETDGGAPRSGVCDRDVLDEPPLEP